MPKNDKLVPIAYVNMRPPGQTDTLNDLYIVDSPLALSSMAIPSLDPKEMTSAYPAKEKGYFQRKGRFFADNRELIGLPGVKHIPSQIARYLTTKFKQPYGDKFKKVLIDIGENDDVVDGCLQLISYAAFGVKKELKIYPTGKYDFNDDEELGKELNELGLDKENQEGLLDFVRQVEAVTHFDQMLEMSCYDALQGGRTGLIIETFLEDNEYEFPVGTPSLLKPMSWYYMGQNLNDSRDWKVKYIENQDAELEAEDRWIPVEDLIYFTWRDSNRNPNKWTYGRSELHAVVKYSNVLRQITERDTPEIVTSYWHITGILSVPEDLDQDVKDRILENLAGGGIAIVDQRATFTPVALKHDGWYLNQAQEQAIRRILSRMRVPNFLLNYDAQSRSVVESAVNSFRDFRITPIRKWVRSVLSPQWYKRLIKIYIKWKKLKEDILRKIEIISNYEEFSVEDLLAKANSIELLVRRDVTSIREARRFYLKLPEKRLEDTKADIKAMVERKTAEAEANAAANPFNQALNATANKQGADQNQQFGIKSPKQRQNARPLAKRGAGAGRQV